jgi:hypothetical protein
MPGISQKLLACQNVSKERVEYLPCKQRALSSNSSTTCTKKKEKEKKRVHPSVESA